MFPAILPAIIDHPEDYLPNDIPIHDILIAISVNEEILIAFIQQLTKTKGIIIPIEDPNWLSPNAIKKISTTCEKGKIAVSFHLMPKTMKGKAKLKRIFYGKLLRLPNEIENMTMQTPSFEHIDKNLPNHRYKVIYAAGHLK